MICSTSDYSSRIQDEGEPFRKAMEKIFRSVTSSSLQAGRLTRTLKCNFQSPRRFAIQRPDSRSLTGRCWQLCRVERRRSLCHTATAHYSPTASCQLAEIWRHIRFRRALYNPGRIDFRCPVSNHACHVQPSLAVCCTLRHSLQDAEMTALPVFRD